MKIRDQFNTKEIITASDDPEELDPDDVMPKACLSTSAEFFLTDGMIVMCALVSKIERKYLKHSILIQLIKWL